MKKLILMIRKILAKFNHFILIIYSIWSMINKNKIKNDCGDFDSFILKVKTFINEKKFNHVNMPWYLVLGSQSVGKTTLLKNSSVDFLCILQAELALNDGISCTCWISDEAVFFDVPSNYIFQDNYTENWLALLLSIKKYRKNFPINRVILAFDYYNLFNFGRDELKRWSMNIHQCFGDIKKLLGYVPPIHLILTKLDQVPGFASFFSPLNQEVKSLAWDIYLPKVYTNKDKINYIKERLNILYQKLAEKSLSCLSMQISYNDKILALRYPYEFLQSHKPLINFLQILLKEERIHKSFDLDAIFFTGALNGKSNNENKDIVMPQLSENLYLNFNDDAYFIGGAFRKILAFSKCFASDSKRWFDRKWFKITSTFALIVFIIGMIGLFNIVQEKNTNFLAQGVDISHQWMKNFSSSQSIQQQVINLIPLFNYLQKLNSYQMVIPWYMRIGLYRGKQLEPLIKELFLRSFPIIVMQPAVSMLEIQLQHFQKKWNEANLKEKALMRGEYYSLLKVYLLLGDNQHVDTELAASVLAQQWQKQHNLFNPILREMIYFYLAQPEHKGWMVKTNIIDVARAQLHCAVDVNNLYAGIRNKGLTILGTTLLENLLPKRKHYYFSNDNYLPLLFTEKGWQQYTKHEINRVAEEAAYGDWVMGEPQFSDPKKAFDIALEIKNLYFNDYFQFWWEFINNIKLKSFDSFETAATSLQELANPQGPYADLFDLIFYHLSISPNLSSDENIIELKKIVAFDKTTGLNKNFLDFDQQLNKLKGMLDNFAISSDINKEAKEYAEKLLSGGGNQLELYEAFLHVNRVIENVQSTLVAQALHHLLLLPLQETWLLILQHATSGIETAWQSEIYFPYQENWGKKFPFVMNDVDVPLDMVSPVFMPDSGILWQFIHHNLNGFISESPQGWRPRTWMGNGANFTDSFIQSLAQARLLRDNLFSSSLIPSFTIEIFPEPTVGLKEISYTIAGKIYRYRNEPQEWQSIRWPGEEPNNDTELNVIAAKNGKQGSLTYHGVWSFFRLLRHAKLTYQSGALRAIWQITTVDNQHFQVSCLIKANGKMDLLQALLSKDFIIPQKIFVDSR